MSEFNRSINVLKEQAFKGDLDALRQVCKEYREAKPFENKYLNDSQDSDERYSWLLSIYIWCKMYVELDVNPLAQVFHMKKREIYLLVKDLEAVLSKEVSNFTEFKEIALNQVFHLRGKIKNYEK